MTNERIHESNKAAVLRFNKEVIEQGKEASLRELVAESFVNRSAPPGSPAGRDAMWFFLGTILRGAFPDLEVEVHDQVAEGDKVTTRKTIRGTHKGELFGIAPTEKKAEIQVIDVVRLENGRYVEHWGVNTLSEVIAQLRTS